MCTVVNGVEGEGWRETVGGGELREGHAEVVDEDVRILHGLTDALLGLVSRLQPQPRSTAFRHNNGRRGCVLALVGRRVGLICTDRTRTAGCLLMRRILRGNTLALRCLVGAEGKEGVRWVPT